MALKLRLAGEEQEEAATDGKMGKEKRQQT